MGKSKKHGKKRTKEEQSLLKMIDQDIISQYYSIKEDTERFQYQLMKADRKTKKKYQKALKSGKPFNLYDNESVKQRKKIVKEMEEGNFLVTALRLFEDVAPVLKLLGRCVGLLVVAILSMDVVKESIDENTLKRLDQIFKIAMTV